MNVNRRSFLKGLSVAASVAAGGCASFNTPVAHRRKPGEKLNMGFIGCGGKGWSDWLAFHKHGENTAWKPLPGLLSTPYSRIVVNVS